MDVLTVDFHGFGAVAQDPRDGIGGVTAQDQPRRLFLAVRQARGAELAKAISICESMPPGGKISQKSCEENTAMPAGSRRAWPRCERTIPGSIPECTPPTHRMFRKRPLADDGGEVV